MEPSKYQTLPGKLSKKKEPKDELNSTRGRETEYLSPVQLSPAHNHSRDYTLGEYLWYVFTWWYEWIYGNLIFKTSKSVD